MTTPTSKEIQNALEDAFRDKDSLARMVTHELNQNLNAIADEGSLSDRIFKLIQWAEAQGRMDDLIAAARSANQGNQSLQLVAEAFEQAESRSSTGSADSPKAKRTKPAQKSSAKSVTPNQSTRPVAQNTGGLQPVTIQEYHVFLYCDGRRERRTQSRPPLL